MNANGEPALTSTTTPATPCGENSCTYLNVAGIATAPALFLKPCLPVAGSLNENRSRLPGFHPVLIGEQSSVAALIGSPLPFWTLVGAVGAALPLHAPNTITIASRMRRTV